jgi:hypothetical protein
MKKVLIGLLFLAVAFIACGQDVVYKDNPTLMFDHVEIGNDNFAWEVYAYDFGLGVTDAQDIAQLTYIGDTVDGTYVLTFPYAADWAVGVRTKFTDDDLVVKFSAVAWSYEVADALSPFVYTPTYSPVKPDSLRDSGT